MAARVPRHGFLLVELGLAADEPAPLWYYAYTDESYVLTHPSLAGLFCACATAAEIAGPSGEDRRDTYDGRFEGPGFASITQGLLEASPHGDRARRVAVEDIRSWPQTWQQAQGVTEESLRPLGPTHSVREFAEAASAGPVKGRIVGRYRVHGGGGFGSYGDLTDDTGSILVLKPATLLDVGGYARDAEIEVELRAAGPLGEQAEPDRRGIQEAALAGDLSRASALGEELAARTHELVALLPVMERIVPLD